MIFLGHTSTLKLNNNLRIEVQNGEQERRKGKEIYIYHASNMYRVRNNQQKSLAVRKMCKGNI